MKKLIILLAIVPVICFGQSKKDLDDLFYEGQDTSSISIIDAQADLLQEAGELHQKAGSAMLASIFISAGAVGMLVAGVPIAAMGLGAVATVFFVVSPVLHLKAGKKMIEAAEARREHKRQQRILRK